MSVAISAIQRQLRAAQRRRQAACRKTRRVRVFHSRLNLYGGSPIPVVFPTSCQVAFTSTPATRICRRGPRVGKSHLRASAPLYTNWRTAIEDGVDDAVHGRHVDEADHGPGSAVHLDEATLDDVGSAQLAPQVFGKGEERQQLGQVAPWLLERDWILPLPAPDKSAESSGPGRRPWAR